MLSTDQVLVTIGTPWSMSAVGSTRSLPGPIEPVTDIAACLPHDLDKGAFEGWRD